MLNNYCYCRVSNSSFFFSNVSVDPSVDDCQIVFPLDGRNKEF